MWKGTRKIWVGFNQDSGGGRRGITLRVPGAKMQGLERERVTPAA